MAALVLGPDLVVGCLHSAIDSSAWKTLNDGAAGFSAVGVGEGLEVKSGHADDTVAGTGTRTVGIDYLTVAGAPGQETISMNGTTEVAAAIVAAFRINGFYSLSYGSGGVNAGLLTLQKISAGGERARILAGRRSAAMGQFTVPLGYRLDLTGLELSAAAATATTPLRISAMLEAEINPATGAYADGLWSSLVWGTTNYLGSIKRRFALSIPALSTVRVRAISDNATGVELSGNFYGVLRAA